MERQLSILLVSVDVKTRFVLNRTPSGNQSLS